MRTPSEKSQGQNICVGFARRDLRKAVVGHARFRRPLEVTACALCGGNRKSTVVVMALDLIGLSTHQFSALQKAVGSALGIPGENVLIHVTHTHSAPDFRPWGGHIETGRLAPILRECAAEAIRLARPASVTSAIADVGKTLSVNRRGDAGPDLGVQTFWFGYRYDPASDRVDASPLVNEMTARWLRRKPTFRPGPKPIWFDGDVDPLVHALRFEDSQGKTLGTVVRFSAHPHITSALRNAMNDPDYPARARDHMESAFGGLCQFLVGPCGNLVPKEHIAYTLDRSPRRDAALLGTVSTFVPVSDAANLRETERIGRAIAAAAATALNGAETRGLSRVRFAADMFSVELDPTLPRSRRSVEDMRKVLLYEYQLFLNAGGPLRELRRLANRINWLEWTGEHVSRIRRLDPEATHRVRLPLAVLCLNKTPMAFMHSEVPVEVTLELRRAYGKHLWTVALTGADIGYLPTPRMIDEGGYEGRSCIISRNAEPQLRRDIASLLRRIGISPRPSRMSA